MMATYMCSNFVSKWSSTPFSILHVRSTDTGTISEALRSSIQQKQLDLRKLIGHVYDGAVTFAGKISWVHKQILTSSAHAINVHCSCHRLQLASVQEAASVKEIRMFFWNHDQRLEVVLIIPPPPQKQRHWRAPRLFLFFPSWRSWSLVH